MLPITPLEPSHFTIGLVMVGLIQNDKATVKGNGSRRCSDSPILPLSSSETLMTPS